jgi:peptidylprolyl isomerase
VVKEIITGKGPVAKVGDNVTINYVGLLYTSGAEFSATWRRRAPISFTLGRGEVIRGWEEGVAGMRVGSRRELIVPSSLGYGYDREPPGVPPNAALVFVVDLLGV